MAKKFIQAQRANIAASRRIMAQSRNMGYKAVNSNLDAIASNLTTSTGRNTAALMGSQGSQLAALRALAAHSKAKSARITERTTDRITNLYGSAIAGGTDLSGMKAAAKAGAVESKGILGSAALLAQGNEAAAATQATGVQMAETAAKYEASQAKLYRAKNDAGLIAQEQLELAKMRLQNKLDLENYRKKLKMDDKENQKANLSSAEAVGTFGAQGATTLLDIFNHVYVGSDGQFHEASEVEGIGTGAAHLKSDESVTMRQVGPAQAVAYYEQQYGITDPNQKLMLTAVSQAMWGAGAGRSTAGPDDGAFNRDPSVVSAAVSQQIAMLYPDLKPKSIDTINNLISSQISYAASEGGGGGGGGKLDDPGITAAGTFGWGTLAGPTGALGYILSRALNGMGMSGDDSKRIYDAVLAEAKK